MDTLNAEPDRDPVDVLAEEFADRLRRGEHPSVGDYASAHPEHAEQLKELLPAVAQMEMLKRFRHPAAEPSLPDRLGDFRIVRELGRGGMGVVFEAVQESLGRPVALKVLARHAQLDKTRRERFVREAQAAAKLHHTNIVPVFGVGEQDGLPYYVMQLIPGSGLHAVVWDWREQTGKEPAGANETEAIAQSPDTKPGGASGPTSAEGEVRAPEYGDWRFVAEVGRQAADALHYAHKQGVLHRDVKPANLILDGETVWVADFGLAKMTNTDGLTATGDILGTLQYIPPECLTGQADARSDVYGLGATLYELLTLESPYTADSPARLIKLVADTDPRPPREVNSGIPRDLETIVLKAMARRPQDRYATAHELAQDLEAFLEDRPIRARRTSAASRAWRWCRRNPAVASLALSTLVALSLAAVAGWAGYARAESRREEAESEKRNAVAAQTDAEREKANAESAKADALRAAKKLEQNLKLSLDTFAQVFEAAGGNSPQGYGIPLPPMMMRRGGPGGPGGHGGGPDRPGGFGMGFAGSGGGFGGPGGPGVGPGGPPDRGPNPGAEPPVGGPAAEPAEKAAILEAVLTFYDRFSEQTELEPRLQFEAAKASRRVCEAHVWLKKPAEAAAAFRRAVALLEPLVEKFPDDEEKRAELVMAYAVAPPEAFPGDPDLPLRRVGELAGDDPWLAGTGQFRIGLNRWFSKNTSGAEAAYRESLTSLLSVEPADRPRQSHIDLACVRLHLAWVLSAQSKWAAARQVLEQSVRELGPHVPQPPGGRTEGPPTPSRWLMGMTYLALGDLYSALRRDADAEIARKGARDFGFVFGESPSGKGGRGSGFGGFGGFGGGGFGGKKDGPPKKDGPKN